jgi:hypothetical protein
MIQSFKCGDTQVLYETGKSRRFANIKEVAEKLINDRAVYKSIVKKVFEVCDGRKAARIWRDSQEREASTTSVDKLRSRKYVRDSYMGGTVPIEELLSNPV